MSMRDPAVALFQKEPLPPCLLQSSWVKTLALSLIYGRGCIRKRFWLDDAGSFCAPCPRLISLFGTWQRSVQAFRLPSCSAAASGAYPHTPRAAITDQRQDLGTKP